MRIPRTPHSKLSFFISLAILFVASTSIILVDKANRVDALSGADWQAGNIIDDSIFYNGNDMSVDQIQSFLNQKVPTCDTNGVKPSELGGGTRAQYAASRGYSLPIICTKEYYENPATKQNNLGTGVRPAGSISAAQIIKNAAAEYNIGTRVLLVILEKEMSLVTDDWPLPNSYRNAMGYACPDTAPCDAQYFGFANQVSNAARQYVIYKNNPLNYRHVAGRNNAVRYNPNIACGSSDVFIKTTATAGLYNYTPYQPNQAALNDLYGRGDDCSAHGNRNFWTMYSRMFGNPTAQPVYSWSPAGQTLYLDAARTMPLPYNPSLEPGQKVYMTIKAKNTGNQTWYRSFTNLGTNDPRDRQSPFRGDDWMSGNRVNAMKEQEITPGAVATFEGSFIAPTKQGKYSENFNVVAEYITWLNDPGLYIPVKVESSRELTIYSDAGRTNQIDPASGQVYAGSKIYARVKITNKSSTTLSRNTALATTNPNDRISELKDNSWVSENRVGLLNKDLAPGDTGYYEFTMTIPETLKTYSESFGLVVDGSGGGWLETNTATLTVNAVKRPLNTLSVNQQLTPGSSIASPDGRYKLVMQTDGNLVLYSPTRAIWATNTEGRSVSQLVMQTDGNLVLYSPTRAIWATNTEGRGASSIVLQNDGNLVIYRDSGGVSWASNTHGRQ